MKKQSLSGILVGLLSSILLLFSGYLLFFFDATRLENFADQNRFLGFIVIFIYIVAGQVVAPISSLGGFLVGVRVYGLWSLTVVLYLACICSSVINFKLAKKYGRDLVIRFVGEGNVELIDKVVSSENNRILKSGRLYGFYFFDILSYAFGLTKLSFIEYFKWTVSLTIIPILLQSLVLQIFGTESSMNLLVFVVFLVICSYVFSRVFINELKRSKV